MHSMAVKSQKFEKLFTADYFKIEKYQMNFKTLDYNELSSLPAGIFDNLPSLETL